MTHYLIALEVEDEDVYRFLQWLDEEWPYVTEKFGGIAHAAWDAEVAADDIDNWVRQLCQYLDRVKQFKPSTAKGRQAAAKFGAVAVAFVGTIQRVHGPLPRGGVETGEIIPR